MLKNHWKNVEKMQNAETMKKCRQKLDPIPCHPNNYTDSSDSELFWENLPQYSILTLIEVQHYPPAIKRGKWKSTRNGGINGKITYK